MNPKLVLFAVCCLVSAVLGRPLATATFLPDTLDVGVRTIIAPIDSIDSGTTVTPACSVYNYGDQTASTYKVRLRVGVYRDSATVDGHLPGTARLVEFAGWTAGARGTFVVSCSTELAGDGNPANDKKAGSVTVGVKDVGVTYLTTPRAGSSYPKDTVVVPKATWRNLGTRTATSFEAWAILLDSTGELVYAKKVTVPSLTPGGSIQIGSFPPCTLGTAGDWTFRCSTDMAGDMVPTNDTMSCRFFVRGEVGVTDGRQPVPAGQRAAATIVRSVLVLREARGEKRETRSELRDIGGRKVMALEPGANDVSGLSPGIYFVRETQTQGQAQAIARVILTR